MSQIRYDLIVIGAGMTGLMLATHLRRQGDDRTILLVDKGRSVGGRMATRRVGGGRADHGAQFFTVRDERFGAYVSEWSERDLVYTWSHGWSNGSIDDAKPDGHPRYAVRAGMNALAKYLAAQLAGAPAVEIRTNVRIKALRRGRGHWNVSDETGAPLTSSEVIVTTPVPQALDLLAAGAVALDSHDHDALSRIDYAPCLCGLFLLDGEVQLPAPGAVQHPNGPITWIADNQRKGISPSATVVTVHMGPDMSRALYTEDDSVVEPLLRESLEALLPGDTTIQGAQVKRWRYALPTVLHPERYLQPSALAGLYIAGDAFGGPRVEGAALSGITLAEHLG